MLLEDAILTNPDLEQNLVLHKPAIFDFQNVVTLSLIVVLVLMALMCTFYRKELKQLLQGLFTPHLSQQLLRETTMVKRYVLALLFPVIILMQGWLMVALLLLVAPDFASSQSIVQLWLLGMGVFSADVLYKIVSYAVFAWIFDYAKNECQEYRLQKFYYLTTISLLLIPLFFLYFYTNWLGFLILYGVLFLFVYLLMIYRAFQLNFQKRNYFQFFLYFCTIEILPYLIVAKLVLSLGG